MDYGRDFLSVWEFNEDVDLKTVSNFENIEQALTNRLTCDLNSMDLFYKDYGSLLMDFLGWKRNEATLDFIRLELQSRLKNELRLENFDLRVDYSETGSVLIKIDLNSSDDYTHTVELELTENGVENIGN